MAAVKTPSSPRRERALETRRRIVSAAHELFVERGFTGAKMTEIALRAGVAVQTVYFTFHTKAELLQACYEAAVLGPVDPQPPPLQPWWGRMTTARNGRTAVAEFARGTTVILSRVGALDDVVRSALHEPDAVEVRRHSELLRRQGYRSVAEHLADRFGLAAGVTVDRATDVMLTLAGSSTYRSLVLDLGWSDEEFVHWLTGALALQLLRVPGRRTPARP